VGEQPLGAAIEAILFIFMIVLAIYIARLRSLFAAAMLFGIFSLLAAGMQTVMDAVDVAFTEAAVGAGISTVLFLGALGLTTSEETRPVHHRVTGLFVVTATGCLLAYGTLDMPAYGDPNAPIHRHVAPHYLVDSATEVGIPNVVTSVLASYRSYDTFGETTVILTAAVGAFLLLGGSGALRKREEDESAAEDAATGEADGGEGAQ
jgi:multicomponent Na+:H+ antiporter subunit B